MQFDPGLEYKPNRGEAVGAGGTAGAIEGPPGSGGVVGVGPGGIPLPGGVSQISVPSSTAGPIVAHNSTGSAGPGGNKDDPS